MSTVMLARVTCPNCQNQFQTQVEQVLDVGDDPSAKVRVFNGLVNMAECPHCGMQGALSLPFLYHDPDKELALIYMPMEAGRDHMERQQAIGKLTGLVMDSLPPEERRAYLLQPQEFLALENMVNRILEADGVTPEMIEAQKAKADLLKRMLEASSDEVLEAMIKANDEIIDADLLRILGMNLEMAQASGQEVDVQKLTALRTKLLALSSEGQNIQARSEALDALREEPTRDKLLNLLVGTGDEQTRELLIAFGRPLLDYPFFQSLTARIEAASDKDEKKQLTALRAEILDVRDRLDEETRALYEERHMLLRNLLLSQDPEELARRRFSELDQVFFNVLSASLEEAQAAGDKSTVGALQSIWNLVLQLMEETLPPELRLFNRLMAAQDEAEIGDILQGNRDLVTERLVQFMEGIKPNMQEEGSEETAEQLALVLQKVKDMVAQGTAG